LLFLHPGLTANVCVNVLFGFYVRFLLSGIAVPGPLFDSEFSIATLKKERGCACSMYGREECADTVSEDTRGTGRADMECDGTRKRTGGEVKGKKANGGGSQQSCTVSDTVYPALLPLIRTPQLPAAD